MSLPRWFNNVQFGRDRTNQLAWQDYLTNFVNKAEAELKETTFNSVDSNSGYLDPPKHSSVGPIIEEILSDVEKDKSDEEPRQITNFEHDDYVQSTIDLTYPRDQTSVGPIIEDLLSKADSVEQAGPQSPQITNFEDADSVEQAGPQSPSITNFEDADSVEQAGPQSPSITNFEDADSVEQAGQQSPQITNFEDADSVEEAGQQSPQITNFEHADYVQSENGPQIYEPACNSYNSSLNETIQELIEKSYESIRFSPVKPVESERRYPLRKRIKTLNHARCQRPIYRYGELIGVSEPFPDKYDYSRKRKNPPNTTKKNIIQKMPKNATLAPRINLQQAKVGDFEYAAKSSDHIIYGVISIPPNKHKPETKVSATSRYLIKVTQGAVLINVRDHMSNKTTLFADEECDWVVFEAGQRYSIQNRGTIDARVIYIVEMETE